MFYCKITDKNGQPVNPKLYAPSRNELYFEKLQRDENGEVDIVARFITGFEKYMGDLGHVLTISGFPSGAEYPLFDDYQLKMLDKVFDYADKARGSIDLTNDRLICFIDLDMSNRDKWFITSISHVHFESEEL